MPLLVTSTFSLGAALTPPVWVRTTPHWVIDWPRVNLSPTVSAAMWIASSPVPPDDVAVHKAVTDAGYQHRINRTTVAADRRRG